jgi:hypothetical protein
MIRSFLAACVGAAVCVALAGCDSGNTSPTTTTTTTTSTSSTTTTTVTTTETFTGTVGYRETKYHIFHTMPGLVTATLAMTPTTYTTGVGFWVGMWDGAACTPVSGSMLAADGGTLYGTATTETDLCLKMHDPDNFAEDFSFTYTVTITHQTKASS